MHDISEEAVQTAIIAGGPIAASFQDADFPSYKSGIYLNLAGDELGSQPSALPAGAWRAESRTGRWQIRGTASGERTVGSASSGVRGKNESAF